MIQTDRTGIIITLILETEGTANRDLRLLALRLYSQDVAC